MNKPLISKKSLILKQINYLFTYSYIIPILFISMQISKQILNSKVLDQSTKKAQIFEPFLNVLHLETVTNTYVESVKSSTVYIGSFITHINRDILNRIYSKTNTIGKTCFRAFFN